MPKRVQLIPFPSKGFAADAPGYLANKDYFNVGTNVRVVDGMLECGYGVTNSTSITGGPANGSHYFRTGAGDTAALLANKADIFRYDVATDTWVSKTPQTFTGADGDHWSFADNFDWCYASNLNDGIFRYNGSGDFVLYDATVSARYLHGFAGRLLVADGHDSNGEFRDRVGWTGQGATSSFAEGGWLDLVDIQGPVTGINSIGSAAFIFKRNAIWRWTETGLRVPVFNSQIVHQGSGAIGGHSLVRTPIGLIYLGNDFMVTRFDGSSQPQPIGAAVQDYIQDNIDETSINNLFAWAHPQLHEYWLLIPSATGWADEILTFDWQTGAWGKIDRGGGSPNEITIVGMRNAVEDAETWGYETAMNWNSESALNWGGNQLGAEELRPWIADDGGTDIVDTRFDDLTAGTPYAWTVEFIENPLDRVGRDKTVTRVIVHGYAPNGATALTAKLSTNNGVTWGTGVNVTPTATAAGQRWLFNTARLTGENFKLHLTSTVPFKLYMVELEVHDREEIR